MDGWMDGAAVAVFSSWLKLDHRKKSCPLPVNERFENDPETRGSETTSIIRSESTSIPPIAGKWL